MVFSIEEVGICRLLSPSMRLVKITSQTSIVMTLGGFIYHPWDWMALMSGLYLFYLLSMAWCVYLSWVNVNYIICMAR